MTIENEFVVYLLELLDPLGSVEAKAMFGGFGIYRDGLMFGLVSDDIFYLKADKENRPDFEEEGLPPFTYKRKGKDLSMSYYQAPHRAMEASEVLCQWAERAFDAAVRSSKGKVKKKSGKKK